MTSSAGPVWRAYLDSKRPAATIGGSTGVPEGATFVLETVLLIDGNTDSGHITSSGTVSLTVSDSVLNAGTALITDKASTTFTQGTGLALFKITNTESNGWESGTYNGDVKYASDSGGTSRSFYWPLKLTVREARD